MIAPVFIDWKLRHKDKVKNPEPGPVDLATQVAEAGGSLELGVSNQSSHNTRGERERKRDRGRERKGGREGGRES